MIQGKQLTIAEAWNELIGINNRIDLLETLKEINGDVKAVKLKDIITSGGSFNNNALLNVVIGNDKYGQELQNLYQSKNAWEKYILDEIDRLKYSKPSIVIGFLKEYQGMTWNEIVDYFYQKDHPISYSQIRRYYDDYKGRSPRENDYFANVKTM